MKKTKSVGRYISCIYRNFHIYLNHQLEQYNIGSGQFQFLMVLYTHDGINQENLSEQLNIDKTTVTRALKKLEKEGYVTRKKDDFDRRSYLIFLTEKAKTLQPEIKTILKKWTVKVLNDISLDEQICLYNLLEKMKENSIKTN
jgi:DNA-binding MarR family transcriptional regulator